jgi:hypothetical protein
VPRVIGVVRGWRLFERQAIVAAKAKRLLGGARMVVVLATILKAMVGALGTRA